MGKLIEPLHLWSPGFNFKYENRLELNQSLSFIWFDFTLKNIDWSKKNKSCISYNIFTPWHNHDIIGHIFFHDL